MFSKNARSPASSVSRGLKRDYGNLESAITEPYHALGFEKSAYRCFDVFRYRLNRYLDFAGMFKRFFFGYRSDKKIENYFTISE